MSNGQTNIKRISEDLNHLKNKKQYIMNLHKDCQKNVNESDKIKRYFQKSLTYLKESKTYEIIKIVEKLNNNIQLKSQNININEFQNTVINEMDSQVFYNSRNNAPKTIKELLIPCLKTKNVLSFKFETLS